MIELKDIDKYVDSRFQRTFILKGVDLTINEGEFVTIMGPSGAGKSTLLNIMGMLDEPSAGGYYFFGEQVNKLKERKKSELHKHYMGFVFQAYHLIDELTVYENIETPLLYRKVKRGERQSMVADALDGRRVITCGHFAGHDDERPGVIMYVTDKLATSESHVRSVIE